MAKINSGIFGPLSGKLGPIIGGTWKGIPYIRENKAHEIKRPRTVAQLANEAKFKFVNDWLVPFQPYLNIGFENLAIRKTALAAAFSANYKTVFSGTAPHILVAYDKLQISTGTLAPLLNPQVSFAAGGTLEITWNKNAVKGTTFNDQVMLVAYSPVLQLADGFVGAVNRANEQYSFPLNPDLHGQSLHIYISVTSIDRRKIAGSTYLGIIDPI